MRYLRSAMAAMLLCLAGCKMWKEPQGQGPQWVERPVSGLVETLGAPDQRVRLPLPSLSTAYMYGVGAVPGFAVCEHDYFIRGLAVVGYREHGSDAGCNRSRGNTE